MDKPIISPDFNMNDLYKLREYNSLRHINMTFEELQADFNKGAEEFELLISKRSKEKQLAVN